MISADTLAVLMAKGLAGEDLLEVVRAIDADGEAQKAIRTKRQERNHRYYESHKDERLKNRLNKTSESDAKVFPSPPYDINNSTPHTPFKNTHIRAREVLDRFWTIYPKRTNRKTALAKLETVLKAGVDPEKILAGAARYAEHMRFTEPQFIKAPDAWLNAGKWDDELPVEPQKPQARAGPSASAGNLSTLMQKMRNQQNGEQSPSEPKDITPSVSEPGTGDPGSRLFEPTGKPSGGGEILHLRPASPDARRSPAHHSEAARTFEWPDPEWERG